MNPMDACRMSVFRPKRRKHFIARWTEPETGKRRERTLGTHIKRDAYRLGSELAESIVWGVSLDDPRWLEFCEQYERQHLRKLAKSYVKNWAWVKWAVEKAFHSPRLSQLNRRRIDRWLEDLAEGRSVNTVATYARRLRAALNWARDHDLIGRAPKIVVRADAHPRGRALSGEEIDRMLDAAEKVRPKDHERWKRLILGEVFSGLRISELLALSWDPGERLRCEKGKRHWLIVLDRKQKNKRKQLVPAFAEFWDLVLPRGEGPVFPIPGRKGQMTIKRAIRTVSDIGKRARIVSDPETGQHATSHDLRRTFATRLTGRLPLADAAKVTRHADPRTLFTYYHTAEAEALADRMEE